ncbi:hypothetical protein [Streptosporangium sp. NBC_01639]|uniref:hypothetical protein n=1 Tax=Streptosporangium sp. NBC_01639 TaxID=2975948 RepID=UPI0038660C1C
MPECELIDWRTFRTRSEAERAVFAYIEESYNPRRRHSVQRTTQPCRIRATPSSQTHSRRWLCCRVAESPDVSTKPG